MFRREVEVGQLFKLFTLNQALFQNMTQVEILGWQTTGLSSVMARKAIRATWGPKRLLRERFHGAVRDLH